VADVAPSPLNPSWTPPRPRRTTKPPRVSYRRSPGAVSRPVPRGTVAASRGASGVTRVLGSFPWAVALSAFFGGVYRNSERAAELQQSSLDNLELRQLFKLARGTERRVRIAKRKPAVDIQPGPSSTVRPGVRPSPAIHARPVANPLTEPAPLPEPELATPRDSDVVRLTEPGPDPRIFQSPVHVPRGAPPRAPPASSPNFPFELPLLPEFFENFRPRPELVESPLLTPFNAPQAYSSPLANPQMLAEPLPEPEPDRCRCRARKRKAGKPGKGFFTIDSRGREKRRYWLNREQREHAGNAG
jgi:hypothetical protein